MIAGRFAGIPVRIHSFTGQVWATRKGIMRLLLKNMDRLLAFFTTHILVDSHSQREFLLAEKVVSRDKSDVLANGSISGVDTGRFCSNPSERANIRKKLNMNDNDMVFLFLGRLNRDKGIIDLAQAFAVLCANYDNVHLLIVGPDEENMKPLINKICQSCAKKVHFVDYTNTPEHYMATADVFCLPSYREGFGSVIIEAASTGIPAIASRIYGITDAIEEEVTGLLHDAGDINQLTGAMKQLIDNPILRKVMGENARIRACRDFLKEKITAALLDYYQIIM
jgi:glycosyltransferase involved in cell wall biosynthesis